MVCNNPRLHARGHQQCLIFCSTIRPRPIVSRFQVDPRGVNIQHRVFAVYEQSNIVTAGRVGVGCLEVVVCRVSVSAGGSVSAYDSQNHISAKACGTLRGILYLGPWHHLPPDRYAPSPPHSPQLTFSPKLTKAILFQPWGQFLPGQAGSLDVQPLCFSQTTTDSGRSDSASTNISEWVVMMSWVLSDASTRRSAILGTRSGCISPFSGSSMQTRGGG